MTRLRSGFLVLFLATALPVLAADNETAYTNINCALTFPSGWRHTKLTQKHYVELVKSPDEMRTVILVVVPVKDGGATEITEAFRDAMRRNFILDGGFVTSDASLVVAGCPCYEIAGWLHFQGKKVSTVSRIMLGSDKAYKVNAMYMDGDAGTDADLQGVLRSFRLLKPPVVPPGTQLAESVVIASFVLLVVAAGTWVIRRQRRMYTNQQVEHP